MNKLAAILSGACALSTLYYLSHDEMVMAIVSVIAALLFFLAAYIGLSNEP